MNNIDITDVLEAAAAAVRKETAARLIANIVDVAAGGLGVIQSASAQSKGIHNF